MSDPYEVQIIRKDRSILSVEIVSQLIKNSGRPASVFGSARDISLRQKTRVELAHSEERYRIVAEQTGQIVYDYTIKTGDISWSGAITQVTGFSSGEFQKVNIGVWEKLIHPKDRPKVLVSLKHSIDNHEFFQREYRFLKKNREYIVMEDKGVVIYEGDKPIRMIGVMKDVTERNEAQNQIVRSKVEWEQTFDAVPDLIAIIDTNNTIKKVNKAVCDRLGKSFNDLIGKKCFEVFHGSDRASTTCPHKAFLQDGKSHSAEVSDDYLGGIFYITVSPLFNKEGEVFGSVHVARDITDRRRAMQLQAQAEKYSAISDLASGVAHNFNNFLQAIVGGAQLAKMYHDLSNFPAIPKSLDAILNSCKFGAETVKRLQGFADIGSKKKHEVGVFDLSKVVEQSIEISRTWWKSTPERLGISINLSTNLSHDCKVNGIESEILEVLINLIKNATEALPNGGDILVATEIVGTQVILKVSDTGSGISQSDMKRLFNPFFTTKLNFGTGLGLATSSRIISDHKGRILVESIEGKGSTFLVELPLSSSELEDQFISTVVLPARNLAILAIDDMESVLDSLKSQLEEYGQKVLACSSGEEGIEILKFQKVDLVICDLGMPGLNGWEVAKASKRLCKSRGVAKIPFIILTGWGARSDDQTRMNECGVDRLLEKPAGVNQLFEVMNELVI